MAAKDLIVEKEYASITEVKGLDKPNENCIRVYRTQVTRDSEPDTFLLQIRTHGGIGDYGQGVKRDMIATVSLTIGLCSLAGLIFTEVASVF